MSKIITRFPPSPTGYLHIGRARTALFNYLFTQNKKGEMVFRIEDTDKERSKKEFEDIIIETLSWLGIHYDSGPFRQSERTDTYKTYLHKMIESGHAYISKETEGANPEVVRFKNPNKKIQFTDLIRGEIIFDTTDLGDFIIARSINDPLYHLAVVVDDFEMGITHILRGEDGISNTPRQILIQEAIGAPRPVYAHIPLILAPDKSKLSGRHGAVSTTEYRDKGYLPEAIVNYLALLGWNPGTDQEIFTMQELIEQFDITKVQKSGAMFNLIKLNWVNKEHLKKMSEGDFRAGVESRLPEEMKTREKFSEIFSKLIPIIKERISFFGEVDDMVQTGELDYYFSAPVFSTDESKASISPPEKMRKDKIVTNESTAKILEQIVSTISSMPDLDFSQEKIKEALWPFAEEQGRGIVLWPMRYSLSGKEKSPDPFTLASILGKIETISRLKNAIEAIL